MMSFLTARNITNFTEYQVAQGIRNIYFPIIASLGITLNVTSFCVFVTSSLRKVHIFAYLAGLAACDTVALIIGVFLLLQRHDIIPVTPVTCKVFLFFFYSAIHTSSCYHVFTTLERFLAVWKPFFVKKWHRLTPPKFGVPAIYGFWLLISSHNFFTRSARFRNWRVRCVPSESKYEDFIRRIHPWLDAAVYCIIPLLFLTTFNILIIIKLRKSNLTTKNQVNITDRRDENVPSTSLDMPQISTSGSQGTLQEPKTKTVSKRYPGSKKIARNSPAQITRTLLGVSFSFIFLTTPMSVVLIAEPFWNYRATKPGLALRVLMRSLGGNLMYTNHAINFFVYLITCRAFREKLHLAARVFWERLKCACCKGLKNKQQVAPSE